MSLTKDQVKYVAKLTKSEQLKDKAKEFFKANKIVEELNAGRRLMI